MFVFHCFGTIGWAKGRAAERHLACKTMDMTIYIKFTVVADLT